MAVIKVEEVMKMMEIKEKAKFLGVKTGKMKKVDLVLAIQQEEGNIPCFNPGTENCHEQQCCWRDDCVSC